MRSFAARTTCTQCPARYGLCAVFALALCAVPQIGRADCISRSLNALAFVQAGDVITTSGPITRHFPGGFVTQDQLVLRCVPLDTAPSFETCPDAYEIDPIARRSGCVNSFATDAICAGMVNAAIRAAEYSSLRHASAKALSRVCMINYLIAIGYLARIWPDNIHLDYTLAHNFPPPRNFRFTVRRWRL